MSEQATTELIAVKMAPSAAEKLATACGWAATEAAMLAESEAASDDLCRTAGEMAEWLGWGARWLLNESARTPLESGGS